MKELASKWDLNGSVVNDEPVARQSRPGLSRSEGQDPSFCAKLKVLILFKESGLFHVIRKLREKTYSEHRFALLCKAVWKWERPLLYIHKESFSLLFSPYRSGNFNS
ncbi:MAG: hypothetical protein IJ418_08255 [Clostridia bacterium]|nr:hypothetical protein [Clostridia bacterium]